MVAAEAGADAGLIGLQSLSAAPLNLLAGKRGVVGRLQFGQNSGVEAKQPAGFGATSGVSSLHS
jgi:hypothetical protein